VNVVIFWYGGHLNITGEASVGDIMAFQWYTFLRLMRSLGFLWRVACARLHVTRPKVSMPTTKSVKSRDKVRAHRERLRRRGLRPIQIWVPDVRSRSFAREAHRQSLLIGTDTLEREEQAFVDAVAEWPLE
jgi:hypothetical protein